MLANAVGKRRRLCLVLGDSMVKANGWDNRIVGEGFEDPEQLLANPMNFRIHPKAQQDALAGVLNEVGWVQRVIVNRTTQHVIDGHLRVSLAITKGEKQVPVIYVDLTEAEEKLVLATIDPLSAMAATDAEKLDALLHEVNSGEAGVQAMLAALAQDMGIMPPDFQPVDIGEQPRLDQKKPIICPHCGREFIHHG